LKAGDNSCGEERLVFFFLRGLFHFFQVLKWGVSLGGAAASADLGGSRNYSNENFED